MPMSGLMMSALVPELLSASSPFIIPCPHFPGNPAVQGLASQAVELDSNVTLGKCLNFLSLHFFIYKMGANSNSTYLLGLLQNV